MFRSVSLTLYIAGCLVFMYAGPAFPQSTAPAPAPAPADFPSYIVVPSEDLNPYDLSTMQKSTETDYRDGAGTLGTSVQRQSNIEVNEALEKRKQERMKAAEEAKAKSLKEASEPEEEGSQTEDEFNAAEPPNLGDAAESLETPGVRGGLFTWTDEQGVLHATNDIGQVPIKYQVEALENSSKNIELKKGTPDKGRP
jgi:hypothetical protein